jgi:phospholipase A-2-activating protein
MQKKIEELNQRLIANGQKDLSLNPTELSVLKNVRKYLESAGATKSSQAVAGGLDLAVKLTTVWPYSDRLPGLDLLRLLAVAPMTAAYTHPRGGNIIDVLEAGVTEKQPPAENNVMMAIRAFVNLFESKEGRALALAEFDKIQALTTSVLEDGTTNRNLLVAATTLYINYAVLFISLKDEIISASFEHTLALLDTLAKILSIQNDSEVVYRAMVATGTLLTLGEEVRSAAKDVYSVDKSVSTAVGKASDLRIRNVSGEIQVLLK